MRASTEVAEVVACDLDFDELVNGCLELAL
jgi:hypothetical protein